MGETEPARRLMELILADPDFGGLPVSARTGVRIDAPKVHPRATEEQLERLRGLGYVDE